MMCGCSPEFAENTNSCDDNWEAEKLRTVSRQLWRKRSALHCNKRKNNLGIHRPPERRGGCEHSERELLADEALDFGRVFLSRNNAIFQNPPGVADMGFNHQWFIEFQIVAPGKSDHGQIARTNRSIVQAGNGNIRRADAIVSHNG